MSRAAEKKAAPGGQTEDGQQMFFSEFDPSLVTDYISNYEAPQGSVAAVLNRGRANGITCREISKRTGLNPRQVTARVYYERRHGAPIISDPYHGFWLAETVDDVRRCVTALHLRAGHIHETARALSGILEGKHTGHSAPESRRQRGR